MGSRYEGPADERRALGAFIALMRAQAAVVLRVHRHLDAAGLTVGQFAALDALYFIGSLRQHELAHKMLCSAGN